ncbi:glutathione S-transferase family protein [Hyaloraphidium curvatum]|nr:glutathione S-transferase family protein [Hyaloraphidium curvatum]
MAEPTLYDSPISRNGYKVRLLLSHLKLPVKNVPVDILAGESRVPEFLKKNAAGRVPVLEFPDGGCLPESNAILTYLADGPEGEGVYPKDRLERAHVLRWMFFEQNMVECTVGTARFMKKTGKDKEYPQVYAEKLHTATDALNALERHLSGGERGQPREWAAAGRFTVADIALYGYISVAEQAGIDMAAFPGVSAWRKRLEGLPGHLPE